MPLILCNSATTGLQTQQSTVVLRHPLTLIVLPQISIERAPLQLEGQPASAHHQHRTTELGTRSNGALPLPQDSEGGGGTPTHPPHAVPSCRHPAERSGYERSRSPSRMSRRRPSTDLPQCRRASTELLFAAASCSVHWTWSCAAPPPTAGCGCGGGDRSECV